MLRCGSAFAELGAGYQFGKSVELRTCGNFQLGSYQSPFQNLSMLADADHICE